MKRKKNSEANMDLGSMFVVIGWEVEGGRPPKKGWSCGWEGVVGVKKVEWG